MLPKKVPMQSQAGSLRSQRCSGLLAATSRVFANSRYRENLDVFAAELNAEV